MRDGLMNRWWITMMNGLDGWWISDWLMDDGFTEWMAWWVIDLWMMDGIIDDKWIN